MAPFLSRATFIFCYDYKACGPASPSARRNPCYAPRPAGSIPAALLADEKKPSTGRFFRMLWWRPRARNRLGDFLLVRRIGEPCACKRRSLRWRRAVLGETPPTPRVPRVRSPPPCWPTKKNRPPDGFSGCYGGGGGQEIAWAISFSQTNRRALRECAQVAAQARRMRLEIPATPRVPRVRSPPPCWPTKKNRPPDGFSRCYGGGGVN